MIQAEGTQQNPRMSAIDTSAVDTLAIDSAQADSVVVGEESYGLLLEDPAESFIKAQEARDAAIKVPDAGMSWIYLFLSLLFCVVGLKFKGSSKYFKALVDDLFDTRTRQNAFDDTVKETSLLVLLNVLWVACAGVLLWLLVNLTSGGESPQNSMSIAYIPARGIGICGGVAAVYLIFVTLAYWVIGNVFYDQKHTRVWLKGAAASTGIEAVILFPIALLGVGYPQWASTLVIIGATVFVCGKFVFIFKGFRIFFTQMSSWLLFLYYLCSLEIIPLGLAYVGAVAACAQWL